MLTEFVISAGEQPKRLDVFLVNRERGVSRTVLQRLITQGRIRLNGRAIKPSQKIRPGDRIVFDTPQAFPFLRDGKAVPLDILFEDEHLVVLNKPAGLVVHPASGHWSGTLVNALLHHFESSSAEAPSQRGKVRPGLVHRLDKDTSGVMVIAKTGEAHRGLSGQFECHTIRRVYEAVPRGVPAQREGLIDLAIGRDMIWRKTVSARSAKPKASKTEYHVRQVYGSLGAHVFLYPRTGRTHQLRVHLGSLGHPILGDPTYSGQNNPLRQDVEIPRLMLHSHTLGFRHPSTDAPHTYTAPPPFDMAQVLQTLKHLTQPIASSGL